jgi:DNA-binding protein YbaB
MTVNRLIKQAKEVQKKFQEARENLVKTREANTTSRLTEVCNMWQERLEKLEADIAGKLWFMHVFT